MTCKNCGTQIPENENICSNCGTLNAEDTNVFTSGAERNVPHGFSSKRNIIIIAAILLICGGITALAVVNSHSASNGKLSGLPLAECEIYGRILLKANH